ncbi:gluconokinase [Herbiconiux solani]|uniref:gluconokinase n=1 Tax=Herbiconiux solani TaxID=661329 RepID=UPI0008249DD4|nr:gluconokinase [Herbiconiux solani]
MTGVTRAVFVTGVSGSGKSTIGSLLAARLGWSFVDADDLHPAANVAKMAGGIPLADDDRWPWLRAVGAEAERLSATAAGPEPAHPLAREEAGAAEAGAAGDVAHPTGVVVACSALRRVYRDLLREECPGAVFVQLIGASGLIAARLSARVDHFMPPSLLDSQLAALEPLATGEAGVAVTVGATPTTVVDAIVEALHLTPPPAS